MDAAERWQILRLHVEDQIPLAALARDTGVGLRTLERWHARFRTEGYTGLGTRRRADAGSHRLPAELVSLVEGLALSKPRPAIITIHRKVSAICEEQGWPVPEPTPVRKIRAAEGQSVVLVAADMPLVREAARNRAVKKTLTIPQWLDELAREKDVNFSLVLQEALKERLRVSSGRRRTK